MPFISSNSHIRRAGIVSSTTIVAIGKKDIREEWDIASRREVVLR